MPTRIDHVHQFEISEWPKPIRSPIRELLPPRLCARFVALLVALTITSTIHADEALLRTHCAKCHGGAKPKGDFDLRSLGSKPENDSVELWAASLDYVKAEEMPPAKQSHLNKADRQRLIRYLEEKLRIHNSQSPKSNRIKPRRLNNREFENSVRDVLLIEDVGTHQPTDNLIGDALHEGFDTHGDDLLP